MKIYRISLSLSILENGPKSRKIAISIERGVPLTAVYSQLFSRPYTANFLHFFGIFQFFDLVFSKFRNFSEILKKSSEFVSINFWCERSKKSRFWLYAAVKNLGATTPLQFLTLVPRFYTVFSQKFFGTRFFKIFKEAFLQGRVRTGT